MGRALLWVLAGFAVLAIGIVAMAPELLRADVGATSQLVVIAMAAGIPGLVVLVVIAASRRRRSDETEG